MTGAEKRPLPRPTPRPAPPRPVRATVPRPPGSGGPVGRTTLPLDTEKLLAARLHAVKVRPYLAGALFALHVVEDRSVPTMAVDAHWRCYVSPASWRAPRWRSWRASGCTRSPICSGTTMGGAGDTRGSSRSTVRASQAEGGSPDRTPGEAAAEHRRRLRDQRRHLR
ncbi:hypothetical protein ACR6C2_10745 [Streptomyces sp. INA 01156]